MTEEEMRDINDVFYDGYCRSIAKHTVAGFRQYGYIPETLAADIGDFRRDEFDENHIRYEVSYQSKGLHPIVTAGITVNKDGHVSSHTELQATLYAAENKLVTIILHRSVIEFSALKTTGKMYLITVVTDSRSNPVSHFELTHNYTDASVDLQYKQMGLFTWETVIHRTLHEKAGIPDVHNWPDEAPTLAALRLFDEQRLIRCFQLWPEELPPDWIGMSPTDVLREVSARIVEMQT